MTRFVLGLNGPIGCGKGWLGKEIVKLTAQLGGFGKAEIFYVNHEILYDMVDKGYVSDAEASLSYDDFKSLPDGRARIIEYSTEARKIYPAIFTDRVMDRINASDARICIIDNIGFDAERDRFFSRAAEIGAKIGVINIQMPHFEPDEVIDTSFLHLEPGDPYPGDCRFRVHHTNGFTFQTSDDAIKTLRELFKNVAGFGPGRNKEIGISHELARIEQQNRYGYRYGFNALMGVRDF